VFANNLTNTARYIEVDDTEGENGASRISLTERKLKLKFQSRRQIPGRPDAQHHVRERVLGK